MTNIFRALKRPFLAFFLLGLWFLSTPILASAESEILGIDKSQAQGFLGQIQAFFKGLWQLMVSNWFKLCDRLAEFLNETFWPKTRQGITYLKEEFAYRRSIFSVELEKETKELISDAQRLLKIIKK